MSPGPSAFWSLPAEALLQGLHTTAKGLTGEEARRRLAQGGAFRLKAGTNTQAWPLLLAQFQSPIILILVFAAGLSFFLSGPADALIILTIIFVSALLGFWQERGAAEAVRKLLAIVQIKAEVLRGERSCEIPAEAIVPGDILVLSAGGSIPGDCLILESRDLFVDEAALTGETYPVEKSVGVLAAETPLAQRTNSLFMGTHVVSGSATAAVVRTGTETEFGKVSQRLKLRPPETEFERGVRRFGYLLLEVTLVLVIAIFAINVYLARPVLDSFLFSLALAVGLTPQLLPAIISINLAHGAKQMAGQKVIVKRLASIENFGSMDVLCADKTGTLTEGIVRLQAALDVAGAASERVLFQAALNASFETGFTNPIDEAIRAHRAFNLAGYRKLDEEPYDFVRKRLSILVATGGPPQAGHRLITKGALPNVLEVCTTAEADGTLVAMDSVRERIQQQLERFGREGFRTLGIACRDVGPITRIGKDHEADMTFVGFLVFSDPPKAGAAATVQSLKRLGVSLKIITGDNRLVAAHVGQGVELVDHRLLTGGELRSMSDEALSKRVNEVDVFAEIEPNQKERIIRSLQQSGHVVGYLGDGINDASALHAADVGISVDRAVDVAKEAADIVLLEKDLGVLVQGVREGRRTFANTLKYVFMATSANFGNMFSMAGASLFLSFLPLLPKQILLTNFLTDIPEMTIATDRVDDELIDRPRRWDIAFIRKFMLTFGLISSVFDYLTFGVLLLGLRATTAQFRTGWFLESVVSASVIVLVIRSRRPLFQSKPGTYLLLATVGIAALTVLVPALPISGVFGFAPLPLSFLLVLGGIVLVYVLAAEAAKKVFYKRVSF
ncbi:MAG: magnesium-translocating P-type ATPase [Nitrospira sp.]|nr:magnesium-translocating P-type ATPase [Nitrospira sp.]